MSKQKYTWWHTDSTGRKIGWMWPEDYVAVLAAIYGDKQWRFAFANYAGLSYNTVCMYASGRMPIPKHVATLVNIMGYHRDKKNILTPVIAEWLPQDLEGPNGVKGVRVNTFGSAIANKDVLSLKHEQSILKNVTGSTRSTTRKKASFQVKKDRIQKLNDLIGH